MLSLFEGEETACVGNGESIGMIRAIFLDLDGTLVGASNTVSPRVRNAVTAARELGCEVILCTGRSRWRTNSASGAMRSFRTAAW
jgi:predicted HAD superfamily phosphohydrolase YqeG